MNQLKVSKIKIGGSPLYYAAGQEAMLENFIDRLGMGEKGICKILQTRKVLRDKNLNPIQKEALKRLKDFAIMLEVEIPGKGIKEIFWKWYLLEDSETERLIKETLRKVMEPRPVPKPAPKPIPKVVKPIAEEARQKAEGLEPETDEKPKKKKRTVKRKLLKKKELETKSEEEKKGTKFKIEEELLKIQEEETEEAREAKPKTPAMVMRDQKISDFMGIVEGYFKGNEITITGKEVIKPNEIDFTIKIPSAVGQISYYCKAKQKKSVNEGDLSTAFVQGQLKKLPVLILMTGKLTKRAAEMKEKQFQHMNIGYLKG